MALFKVLTFDRLLGYGEIQETPNTIKGGRRMATKDFEVQQLLKAYRKGVISDELFEAQMKELGAGKSGLDVENVLALRGDASKVSAHVLQKTPQSQTMAFTIPANFSNDRENTHKGDQIIYVVDGCAIARVSGKEQEI